MARSFYVTMSVVLQCLGLRGMVHDIDKDGDVCVEFMNGDKFVILVTFSHPAIITSMF